MFVIYLDKFLNASNEAVPSNTVLTCGLKRSLLNESVDSFKIKRNKPTKNESMKEPFEVNNNDDIVLIESDNDSNDNVKLINEKTQNKSVDSHELKINKLTKNSIKDPFGVNNNDEIVLIESDSDSNDKVELSYEKRLDGILEKSMEENGKDFPFLFELLTHKDMSFEVRQLLLVFILLILKLLVN